MQRTRTYPIQIRVTEGEKRRLQRNARACRMSLSAYLRQVGLGKAVQAFPTEDFRRLYHAFCTLRDEFPYQDIDWIERQLQTLTNQFYALYAAQGRGSEDGSHQNLAD